MKAYIVISLLVLGLLLAGCPGLGGTPTDQECPEIEQPVCGADGTTYTNPCFAHKAGVNVAHEGPCTAPPAEECSDGDGGKDIFVAGSVLGPDGNYQDDYCVNPGTVMEYYCEEGEVAYEELPCPVGYVCLNGLCEVAPCTDSDEGMTPGEQGTVTAGTEEETDSCEDETTVKEFICSEGAISFELVDCPPSQHCVEGACVEYECEDSDGGEDEHTAGTVTKGDVSQEDACYNPTTVKEYYCEDGLVKSKNIQCGSDEHCEDGACVENPSCSDSDGGKDRYTRGTTTLDDTSHTDTCYSTESVIEYYCEDGEIQNVKLVCGIGYECSGGKCVEEECEEEDFASDPQRYRIYHDDEVKLFGGELIELEEESNKFLLELKDVPDNESAIFALYESYGDYLDNDDICDNRKVELGNTSQDICGEDADLDLEVVNDSDNFVEIKTGNDFNFVQYRVLEGTTYDGSGCPDDVIEKETSHFYPYLDEDREGDTIKVLNEEAEIVSISLEDEEITIELDGDEIDLEDGSTFECNDNDYEVDIDFEDEGISELVVEKD
ncbi:MAG: Kazal-type serine protease inhibitor family protein [Candidatus Micrarchaeia archaeon]